MENISNDNVDYDTLIRQFDDLVSELSRTKEKNKNCPGLYHVKEENKRHEDLIHDVCFTKRKYNGVEEEGHSSKQTEYINKIESVEQDSRCKVNYTPDSAIMLKNKVDKDSSIFAVKESVSWIDSNLWNFEKEKQLQKSVPQAVKQNISSYNYVTDFKSRYLTQTSASSLKSKNVPDSFFHKMQFQKQKSIHNLDQKDFQKNHPSSYVPETQTRVPYLGILPNHKYQIASRSPLSKYILPNNCFIVKLFVESRDLHLGPFPLEIYPKMSLRLLKLKVEQEHNISTSSQRWILGKCFAIDNDKSLADYKVTPGSPIILYVDNNLDIYYDASKNTFFGIKHVSQAENKKDKDREACEVKECTAIENFHLEPEYAIYDEDQTKDSLSSVHASSSGINNFDDNISVTVQDIDSTFQNIEQNTCKKKSAKKKCFSKSTELKKKSTIQAIKSVESNKNNKQGSSLSVQNLYPKSPEDFTEDKSNVENNSSFSVETGGIYGNENTSFFSTELLNENQNAIGTDDSVELDRFAGNVGKQPYVSEMTSYRLVNLDTSEDISNNITNESNVSNQFHSVNTTEDQKVTYNENKPNKRDVSNINNSLISLVPDRLLAEGLESAIEFNKCVQDASTKSEIYKIMVNETAQNDTSLELNESKEKVLKGRSMSLTSKLDLVTQNEKAVNNLFNSSCAEETEKLEISPDNNASVECTIPKSEKSVKSLIRKLSLTRKSKSLGDSSYLHDNSDKLSTDKITDENVSLIPTLSENQSSYSDVYVEIAPQPPSQILKSTETCENEKLVNSTSENSESVKNFELLLEIENMDLVENTTSFFCPVCLNDFKSGQGVILHDCLHVFCRDCLISSVVYTDGALVKCPYRDDSYSCQSHLQQREIKALVSADVYEKYLQRSIITAEGSEERSFHCKTLDCPGWCIYDVAINVFHCPVCFHYNCLNCQAIHEGLNCRQYQDKLKLQQKVDVDAQKTLQLLNKMIEEGKALRCPKCDLILMKKWGCDWLKCSICKTEICWITKGPRWGPGGQGDTSGGCRCGVNGVKCHPSCTYCH